MVVTCLINKYSNDIFIIYYWSFYLLEMRCYFLKRRILILLPILIVIAICTYLLIVNNTSKTKYNTIEFTVQPPNKKTITKKKDIQKIESIINSLVLDEELDTEIPNGWYLMLKLNDDETNTIIFSGDYVNINGKLYNYDKKILQKLLDLYPKLKYNEE